MTSKKVKKFAWLNDRWFSLYCVSSENVQGSDILKSKIIKRKLLKTLIFQQVPSEKGINLTLIFYENYVHQPKVLRHK